MTEILLGKEKKPKEVRTSPLDGAGTPLDAAWFEQPSEELPFARSVMTTPLHLVAASENRTNRWVDWNGYTLAEIYTSFEQEYDALRTRAAISDISPLVKYRISGKEADAYLDRLLTRAVATLPVDGALRAVLCNGDGHIVTEGLLFRMGKQDYRLVVRSSHLGWLLDAAQGFEVSVEDVSGTIAAISLAGPLTASVLSASGVEQAESLSKNRAAWVEIGGMPVYVSHTGMMGGREFELWIDPEDAPVVWQRLLDEGTPYGVKPVGMAVRNLARLENGVPLEGVDYGNAFEALGDLSARSPYDLGLADLVDLENPVFNGRKALSQILARGSEEVFICIEVDAEPSATLGTVCTGEQPVGRTTSCAWSPSLQRHIALALIKTHALGTSDEFMVEVAQNGPAQRAKRLPAKLTKRHFLSFS